MVQLRSSKPTFQGRHKRHTAEKLSSSSCWSLCHACGAPVAAWSRARQHCAHEGDHPQNATQADSEAVACHHTKAREGMLRQCTHDRSSRSRGLDAGPMEWSVETDMTAALTHALHWNPCRSLQHSMIAQAKASFMQTIPDQPRCQCLKWLLQIQPMAYLIPCHTEGKAQHHTQEVDGLTPVTVYEPPQ